MRWMLGVVLALGLTGCSWQDDVKVRGEGRGGAAASPGAR